MSDQQESCLGQQIGEYRLMCKLGGGSFGTVYLAEHVYERTHAAVEVLSIQVTKSEDFKDFINEARMIKLHHPHIVPLLGFGTSRDDLPFLVMEYAGGGTLRDCHPKGERVPLPIIVSYVDQLASALQYAHDHRVIHRDVKPENILVRADGTLLVSDFGVAKFLEQSVLISQQTPVGTPMYIAPEQHMGYPCFASDQYALAVVVYEWICGVRPFQGTALGLAAQHMNTPPLRLRDYLPELSEEVERVVLKALAKVPEDRFESIQKFADALREAVQSPPSTVVLSQSIETRNTVPFIPSGQVSQLASGPLQNRASPSSPKPRSGRRFSWLVRGGLGLLLVLTILLITVGPIVPVQRGPSSTPVTPKHPSQIVQQKWTFSTGGEYYNVSAPMVVDGMLYVGSGDNKVKKVYAVDASTGQQKWAFPTTGSLTVINGVLYIGSDDNKIYAVNISIGEKRWVFLTEDRLSYFSPTIVNGVLYVASDSKVYAINANTGQQKWVFKTGWLVDTSPVVINGVVYVGCNDRKVYAIDASTGQQRWAFETGDWIDMSPTVVNGVLYIGSHDGKIYALKLPLS